MIISNDIASIKIPLCETVPNNHGCPAFLKRPIDRYHLNSKDQCRINIFDIFVRQHRIINSIASRTFAYCRP